MNFIDGCTIAIPNEYVDCSWGFTTQPGTHQRLSLPAVGRWFQGMFFKTPQPFTNLMLMDCNWCPIGNWPVIPASEIPVFVPTPLVPNMNPAATFTIQFDIAENEDQFIYKFGFFNISVSPAFEKYYNQLGIDR